MLNKRYNLDMRTINNLCAIIARRPDAVAFVNESEA